MEPQFSAENQVVQESNCVKICFDSVYHRVFMNFCIFFCMYFDAFRLDRQPYLTSVQELFLKGRRNSALGI